MRSNSTSEPGARWMRCDLHVHSPFDKTKKFGEDIRQAIEAGENHNPEHLRAIAKKFVDACQGAADGRGLDLVAITDHNSIDGYCRLKSHFEAIDRSASDQEFRMPVILPGVEFSVGGERPIHFLVIFSSDTCTDDIKEVIRHVFGSVKPFNPTTDNPQATGLSITAFLDRLYEYCRPDTGERNLRFVLLPAHAEGNSGLARETGIHNTSSGGGIMEEMKGHLRQQVVTRKDWHGFETNKPFNKLPQAFQDLLLRWEAARHGSKWEDLNQDKKQYYRKQKHWPLVRGSDPDTYEKIGKRYSWLKMETPDVEGVRLALLDPESRLRRDGPPTLHHTHIKRVIVKGTDFFEDIEVNLSPCLTTLIGGRGSGKSTLIEYLRYVLDRNRNEDISNKSDDVQEFVQSILHTKDQRDHGSTKGTILPDHQISVVLSVGGQIYQVCRTSSGITIIRDDDQQNPEHIPTDVRALLLPRILSQRQIAQIARDPASQRHELDALIGSDALRDIEKRQETLTKTLTKLQGIRKQLSKSKSKTPEVFTELQKTRDQISFIERDDRRKVLTHFSKRKQQHMWLEDALKKIEILASELMDSAEKIEELGIEENELPAIISESTWLNSVADRIRKERDSTIAILKKQNHALLSLRDDIHAEQAKNWQPDYDKARLEYDTLITEMKSNWREFTNHERLLQRQTQLERESNSLLKIGEELEKVDGKIENVQLELDAAYRERFNVRQEQAQALEEMDADVRLKILAFGDRNDFESRREQWFGGAGLQERDWKLLCSYIFKTGDHVPDRLRKLLRALRSDIDSSANYGRTIDASDSRVASLLRGDSLTGLTRNFLMLS